MRWPPLSSVRLQHGALSRRGSTSTHCLLHSKHGPSSKHLRTHLLAYCQSALADPQLLELNDDIALVTTGIEQLLDRLASAALLEGRGFAAMVIKGLKLAPADEAEQLAAIGQIPEQTSTPNEALLWGEIRVLIDQRERLVRVHARRQKDLRLYLPVDQAMSIILSMAQAVSEEVGDPAVLRRI